MANTLMKTVLLEDLFPSSTNPRKSFDQKQLDELTESIKEKGVVQPILVRPHAPGKDAVFSKYEIVTGERRYRAAKAAGLTDIPAMIKDLSDQDALEIQVIENLQRANVHPLEEAEGYAALNRRPGCNAGVIAAKIGQSEKYVYDRLKLLSLIPKAKEYFVQGKFTAGHAIILARLSPDQQKMCIESRNGGMFDYEHAGHLFDEKSEKEAIKCRSVRELQVWVDDHVRFDKEKVDQMIFPETAKVLESLKEKAEKVVSITEDFHVQTSARNDERVIGPRSWVRADGKAGTKTCDYSVTGVFAVGPGRGTAMKVCIAKEKCKTHWASWQKERIANAKRRGSPKSEIYSCQTCGGRPKV